MPKLKTTPNDIQLHVRHADCLLNPQWEKLWVHNNPIESHMTNHISACIETLEDIIITAVEKAQPQITDNVLLKQTELFLQQEASHNKLHVSFNQFLEDEGYAHISSIRTKIMQRYKSILDDDSRLEELLRLATSLEHFTGVVGHRILTLIENNIENVNPTMAYLYGYHATEEMEHKGVCFDCYQHVFQQHPCHTQQQRQQWVELSDYFNEQLVFAIRYFLNTDRIQGQDNPYSENDVREHVSGPGGLLAKDGLYYDYLKPNFHPWDIDDRKLIASWDQKWEPLIRKSITTNSA